MRTTALILSMLASQASGATIKWQAPDQPSSAVAGYRVSIGSDISTNAADYNPVGVTTNLYFTFNLEPGVYCAGVQTVGTNGLIAEIVASGLFEVRPSLEPPPGPAPIGLLEFGGKVFASTNLNDQWQPFASWTMLIPAFTNNAQFYRTTVTLTNAPAALPPWPD